MTSTNLTREEARRRAALIDVHHYDVSLNLTEAEATSGRGAEEFTSISTIRFTAREEGETFVDIRAARIEGARLDGKNIRPTRYDPDAGIPLSLTAGEHTLRVVASCRYSRTGEGLHRFIDPADQLVYTYTQFETAEAKRMFACFDQPDLKATYDLTVKVPHSWRVIGNAAQQHPERGIYTSRIDVPLSTYLVAVCAGPYHQVRDVWRGELTQHPETSGHPLARVGTLEVPLGLYCRQSLARALDAKRLFVETKQGFDYYHRHFGVAYPFGKYDQVFVPEFNAGAMENAGCVTIRDEYLFTSAATHYRYERRADTILHELAHMWFGDLVTMQWWDDLWLNESFATWASAMSQAEETQYDTAWITFNNVEKAWAYEQDQLPTTHPISTDASDIATVELNFDGITYAKGASVLKQLQAYAGREEFFAGVRRHFAAHAWGNATFDDLLGHLEDASGRDLSGWADQWLKTTGVSEITPVIDVRDGRYSRFEIAQTHPRTHRVAIGLYSLIDGRVVRTRRVEIDLTGERTAVEELVGAEAADLILANDEDLTYCLMRLDPRSMAFLREHIDAIHDPMARSLCWSAAWEATLSGTLRARDFVDLARRGVPHETQLGVLEKLLSQVDAAVNAYADPSWAAGEGREILTDILVDGALNRDPEAALVFAQRLARVPLAPRGIDYLRGILRGEGHGLSVDNDLRWLALTGLIAHGEITDPETAVAEAFASDRTSSGRTASIRALAAKPSATGKNRIVEEVLAGALSNRDSEAKIAGLTWAGADKYLASVARRYFGVARRTWDRFSSEMAQQILVGLYPRWDVTEGHLAKADEFLADDELPSALRRLIVEGRERVARRLRLRGIDAAS